VAVDLDILSFIPPEEHLQELNTPAVDGEYFLLLLPYYDELLSTLDTVEAEFTGGFEAEYPVPETRVEGDITLSFTVVVELSNIGESGHFEEVSFGLFAAPLSAENVYTDGQEVLSLSIQDLTPGSSTTIQGTRTVSIGDPGFELLTTGAVRLGARGYFRAQGPADVRLNMRELRSRISVRPFSLIP
jgi:hypothetical protein